MHLVRGMEKTGCPLSYQSDNSCQSVYMKPPPEFRAPGLSLRLVAFIRINPLAALYRRPVPATLATGAGLR